ncbi:hypothetical protein LHA01_27880 [Schleiferilactobacillus harbinensis]|nr:hypothetical protein LHA01_27880 [Schleiferilactobacillus harbinensis]
MNIRFIASYSRERRYWFVCGCHNYDDYCRYQCVRRLGFRGDTVDQGVDEIVFSSFCTDCGPPGFPKKVGSLKAAFTLASCSDF